MTDFADVEEFVRQHAGCGGLTPSATAQPAGGFLLTLTCVCRQTFDRRVTAAEAKQPLPPLSAPPRTAPGAPPVPPASSERVAAPRRSRQASDPPRATPSREIEEALRAALDAEPDPEIVVRPVARSGATEPAPREERDVGGPRRLASDATPPTSAAGQTSRVAPTPGGVTSRPRRPPVARLDLDGTIREALDRQRADAGQPRKSDESASSRRVWPWLLVVAVFGLAGGAYQYLNIVSDAPVETNRSVATGSRSSPEARAALEEVVRSLRQLQASTPPASSFPVYSSRVLIAKADVERFGQSTAPAAARTGAREFIELHLLATSTLRARSVDRKETWEALARDRTISLCADVRTALDRASQVESVTLEQARSAAVSAAVPKLWDCARARLAGLERLLAEQR